MTGWSICAFCRFHSIARLRREAFYKDTFDFVLTGTSDDERFLIAMSDFPDTVEIRMICTHQNNVRTKTRRLESGILRNRIESQGNIPELHFEKFPAEIG